MTVDGPIDAPTKSRNAAIGMWLVISIIAAIGVGKAVVADVHDPDWFWHVRVAEQLLREGIHPIVDQLSYSSIKTPWTPYSWLAELGMKWLWDTGGIRLSLLVRCAMVVGTIVFVALASRALAGPERRMPTIVGLIFFAYLSLPYLSFRPATAAILLLAVCAWLLLRDRRLEEKSREVWLVIPITALTINIHLTAIVIPMWVTALLAGALFEKQRRSIKRYALLLTACGFANLATPLLPGVIASAWNYHSKDVMVASGLITEMQPVYNGWAGAFTMAVLALFFYSTWRGKKNIRIGDWLMLAIGTILMFRLGRFAPIFAITAAPICAATMPNLNDKPLRARSIQIVTAIALCSFLFRVVNEWPGRDQSLCTWLNRPILMFHYPCESADWVGANVQPKTGRLINDFTWGGYLEWRLGPKFQTLLDGRTQLFTADFWHQTILAPDDNARSQFIAKQNADAAIISTGKSRFRGALQLLGWTRVHQDHDAEVWLPPRETN